MGKKGFFSVVNSIHSFPLSPRFSVVLTENLKAKEEVLVSEGERLVWTPPLQHKAARITKDLHICEQFERFWGW